MRIRNEIVKTKGNDVWKEACCGISPPATVCKASSKIRIRAQARLLKPLITLLLAKRSEKNVENDNTAISNITLTGKANKETSTLPHRYCNAMRNT